MFQNFGKRQQWTVGDSDPQQELHKCVQGAKLEVSRNNICFGKQLGTGAFGSFFKAKLTDHHDGTSDIVVRKYKVPKDGCRGHEVFEELKVRLHVGKHENIVNLIGINTLNIAKGKLWMLLEYCELDVLSFLRRNHSRYKEEELKSSATRHLPRDNNPESSDISKIPSIHKDLNRRCLLLLGYQAAKGMDFLASKSVVHGSLCAANLLLASDNIVKVTGFERPQDIYIGTEHIVRDEISLSLKWMAIETLRERTFSIKSDIWAYGIVLWEIFSLGSTPYPGMSTTTDFIDKLSNGLHNEKPRCAKDFEYNLMLECWRLDPLTRPTYSEIIHQLQKALEKESPKTVLKN
ncbi:mast/stem cell growth factor receptor Kit-like [Penaeus japonicus]|uniref:mast/stem cell growth factor receptor Kit-like n=1 Tax=Penaeus japonicus TaxID=27405 RepID=UPI001C70C418|nr:mast/stem cell growth factor receptor Kit-like [Penaeus japonicus]XP_042876691.1 mast/stem cell growth factor receptor Kit-like [Penaeus japonicus]XP_042876692.1 mast/stem cell growth factor receptor Kit-like [Penaeus japonicus]